MNNNKNNLACKLNTNILFFKPILLVKEAFFSP